MISNRGSYGGLHPHVENHCHVDRDITRTRSYYRLLQIPSLCLSKNFKLPKDWGRVGSSLCVSQVTEGSHPSFCAQHYMRGSLTQPLCLV